MGLSLFYDRPRLMFSYFEVNCYFVAQAHFLVKKGILFIETNDNDFRCVFVFLDYQPKWNTFATDR